MPSKKVNRYKVTYTYYPEGRLGSKKPIKSRDTAYGETAKVALRAWKRGLIYPARYKNIKVKKV